MTAIDHSLSTIPSRRRFAELSVRMSAVFNRYCYHRTISALSGLTDRDLQKAGIARADIPAIAARTIYGR